MDAKTRQLMKSKQGKVETGSGTPGGADGYEGQVQVRDTKDGPMLFAKLKGKWIQSPLLPGGNSFIPKAFTADIILPSGDTKPFFIIPKEIPIKNILYISILVDVTTATESFRVQLPVIHGTDGASPDNVNFHYWLTARLSDRALFFSYLGVTWRSKPGIVTILYK